jgi:colicin import membrane protein
MSTLAVQRDALMPRSPDSKGPGFALALLAHAALVVALAFGVNWKASDPEGVEAELWASVPQIAAPKATEPEPTPVKPEPKPEPQPVAKPEPKPQVKEEVRPDAQIAIEKARKEDERKKKEEAEKLAQQQKAEKLKLEKEEKRKKELEDQRLAAEHKKAVERMLAAAGGGEPNSTGKAQQTSGPSASYMGRVIARIKPHVQFPVSTSGDPAEVTVTVAPDGTIMSYRIAKSSGSSAFDDAALRAVQETAVLPRDNDGRVPSPMTIVIHRPGT